MRIKYLFFLLILIILVNPVKASDNYIFENKEEFIGFLDNANSIKVDLRNNYMLSNAIKENARKYEIDLNYYPNLKLYDSIFSPFSWFLTGFVTADLGGKSILFDKTDVFPGEILTIEIKDNSLLPERIEIMIGDNLFLSFPKSENKIIKAEIPKLESGKYIISVKGTSITHEINIKNPVKEDPLLITDKTSVEIGEKINIKGANFPVYSENVYPEKNVLNIFANDLIVARIPYPSKGVFEAIINTETLKPGTYFIFVEGYKTASTKVIIKTTYLEPKIRISQTVFTPNGMIEIFGENFDTNPEFIVYGTNYNSKITDIQILKGQFHKILNSPSEPGDYTITSKDNPSIFVSFKVIKPDIKQKIFTEKSSVERGQLITIKGEGFEEGQKVSLIREDSSFERIIASCDEWGRFVTSIDTKNYYLGKHKIYLQSDSNILTYFNIEKEKPLPEIFFKGTVYESENFIISGKYFYNYNKLSLYANEIKISDITIKDNAFESTIFNNLKEGNYKLSLRESNNKIIISQALNVIKRNEPVLRVITDNIYTDSVLSIRAFYLEKNVEIFLGEYNIDKGIIDKDGSLRKEIDLSKFNIKPGFYKLYFKYVGEENVIAFTSVKIQEEKPNAEMRIIEKEIYSDSIIHIIGNNFYTEKVNVWIDDTYFFEVLTEKNSFQKEINLAGLKINSGPYKIHSKEPVAVVPLNILPGSDKPTIKLDKEKYIAGETIILTGINFDDLPVLIIVDNDKFYNAKSSQGTFELKIDSSDFSQGYHKLWVQGYDAISSFYISKIPENPVLIIEPEKVILGNSFKVKGINFDKNVESIVLLLNDEIEYIVYPNNGNFNFELDSNKIGLGFHKIKSPVYGTETAFTIIKESGKLLDLNSTLYQGQDIYVTGKNFEDGQNSIFIDGKFVSGIFIENGEFNTKLNTNNLNVGYHILNVEDISGGFNLLEKILDQPEIRLSHSVASPGLLMGISGINFPKIKNNPSISILLDGKEILEIPYPEEGVFKKSYTILNMDEGEHIISVKGYPTANARFIYEKSPIELSMTLFDSKFMPNQEINGVINGLTPGARTSLDLVINSKPYLTFEYSGMGFASFNLNAPNIPLGIYDIGIAGYNPSMSKIEILGLPKEQEQKEYSDEEIKQIKEEVSNTLFGESNIVVEEKSFDKIDFEALQNRVLGNVVVNWIKESCIPNCENMCGQVNGCGGYCSDLDKNEPGKCGNPSLDMNNIQKSIKKISEPVSNILAKNILFLD